MAIHVCSIPDRHRAGNFSGEIEPWPRSVHTLCNTCKSTHRVEILRHFAPIQDSILLIWRVSFPQLLRLVTHYRPGLAASVGAEPSSRVRNWTCYACAPWNRRNVKFGLESSDFTNDWNQIGNRGFQMSEEGGNLETQFKIVQNHHY